MQIKREDFLQEIREEREFRMLVRSAIAIVESKSTNEESTLRNIIRNLVLEAKAKNMKVHDNTGVNYVEDLFSGTSFVTDLKKAYTSLTTSPRQRESFKAHILNALDGLLERDELNRQEDDETEEANTSLKVSPGEAGRKNIDLNITDNETQKEAALEKQGADKFRMLPGMDESGAIAAETIWPSLESNIKNALIKALDPRDRAPFEKYLVENVIAYFEEWEPAMLKHS